MINNIDIKNKVLYIDGVNFVEEIIKSCPIHQSNIPHPTSWLALDTKLMGQNLKIRIADIVDYISNLRKLKDEAAIDLSDAFYQSFSPLMNVFAEQNNFFNVTLLWGWILNTTINIEKSRNIFSGKGLHKGTAFYFLAFSEAIEEDNLLSESILSRHQKGVPPVVKTLLLDLSEDNFAHGVVTQIRETVQEWETHYSAISRSRSIFKSLEEAITNCVLTRELAIHICYAIIKAFVAKKYMNDLSRPTSLTIGYMGENILRFARTLEDLIRFEKNLGMNDRIYDACHESWFNSENWSAISKYENNISGLTDDFMKDKWKLSKDGRNMLFALKMRNVLAHRIPNDAYIYTHFVEIIIAIASSIGFVCDHSQSNIT